MLRQNSFDGGSNGTTITTANSGGISGDPFQVIVTPAVYDSTHARGSGLCAKFTSVAAASNAQWTGLGSVPQLWFRIYLYVTANPTANTSRILSCQTSAATVVGALFITTTGKLQWTDTGGVPGLTSTNSVNLNAWTRVEGFITGSATVGQQEFRLFLQPDSVIPTETGTSAANVNTAGLIDRASYGPSLSTTYTEWLDDIAATDLGYSVLGPVAPARLLVAVPGLTWRHLHQHRQELPQQPDLVAAATAAGAATLAGDGGTLTAAGKVTVPGAAILTGGAGTLGASAGIPVPGTIDGTGATDVTAAINSWIASVPDGSMLAFTPGATYRVDGTLLISGRSHLTILGNGALFRTTQAPVESQCMWQVQDSTGIALQDMTLTAAYATPGTFSSGVQHAHAIGLFGAAVTDIRSVTMNDFAGDGIYWGQGAGPGYAWSSGGAAGCTVSGTGRNGMSFAAASDVTCTGNEIGTIGLFGFDVEPNALANFGAARITIDTNTIHACRSEVFQVIGNAPVTDIAFTNNAIDDPEGTKFYVGGITPGVAPPSRPADITISGNTGSAFEGTNPTAINCQYADGLTVQNNSASMWCSANPTYLIYVLDCTGITVSGNTMSPYGGSFPPPQEAIFVQPAILTGGAGTLTAAGGLAGAAGTAALAGGAGNLTAAGAVAVPGAAALVGSGGTLAAAGGVRVPGAAALAGGSGTLTAAGTAVIPGTASLPGGPGTLGAAGTLRLPGAAVLAGGSGTLAGAVTQLPAASLAGGPGTLTAAATVRLPGAAALAGGGGGLAASGTLGQPGAAALTGGPGTLGAMVTQAPSSLLAGGSGILTATPGGAGTGTAALTGGPGTLATTATLGAAAALAGSGGNLTAAGSVQAPGAAALTGGPGALAAAGTIRLPGAAVLAGGPGTMTAAGTLRLPGAAVLAGGPGSLTAAGAAVSGATAALHGGAGTLAGLVTLGPAANLTGSGGGLGAAGTLYLAGGAVLAGSAGNLAAAGTLRITAAAVLAGGDGILLAAGQARSPVTYGTAVAAIMALPFARQGSAAAPLTRQGQMTLAHVEAGRMATAAAEAGQMAVAHAEGGQW